MKSVNGATFLFVCLPLRLISMRSVSINVLYHVSVQRSSSPLTQLLDLRPYLELTKRRRFTIGSGTSELWHRLFVYCLIFASMIVVPQVF